MGARPELAADSLHAVGVTRREQEILWLVADHLRNREIAERLFLSERTVESHVSSLLSKLGLPDRHALVQAASQLRSRPGARSALPEPLSSFIGRGTEIGELRELVAAHRLVTLTGPTGSGKTRLALEIARSGNALPTPAVVDLAILPRNAAVERAFADALGVAGEEVRLRSALREFLSGGEHWLLVDNCEHVAAPITTLLFDLLASTRGLHVLATSQVPLGLTGEVVYQVPPLVVPSDTDEPAEVLDTPSGRLFAERAAAAAPGFLITEENARDVASLCRRLDGLPLAIELAAARIRVFSARELLAHLDERFALLSGAAKTAGTRYVSLEEALRWSYELLDGDERLLFERCAVFSGDFDYDTAVAILAYEPLDHLDLARLVPRLLDRSLISISHRALETQYRMLDSIRQFAHSRLSLRGEVEGLDARHARYHLEHGASLVSELRGRGQQTALRWFDRRWDDVRVAMRWTLDRQDLDAAWKFVAGVGTAWDILGMRGELFDWLDVLLGKPLLSGDLGTEAAVTAALVLWYQDRNRSLALAEQALKCAGENHRLLGLAHLALGRAMSSGGAKVAAARYLEQAAAAFRRLGDDWHYANALEFLSGAVPYSDDSWKLLAQAADIFGRLGDRSLQSNCLNQMAHKSIEANTRLEGAELWLGEARALAELSGNRHEVLHAELEQARLDQLRGAHESTALTYSRLLGEFRRIGDGRCVSRCLFGLGWAASIRGDHQTARRYLSECVEVADRTQTPVTLAAGLRLLALVDHAAGRALQAATFLGAAALAAEQLDVALREALPPEAELRAVLEREVQADALASALAEGRRRPIEELLLRSSQGRQPAL